MTRTETTASGRQVHLRTCPLCEAMCGLEIHVRDEQVELIRADRDDVWSKGHLCPKGTTLGHLHHDPDRLRTVLEDEYRAHHLSPWPAAHAGFVDEVIEPGETRARLVAALARQDSA